MTRQEEAIVDDTFECANRLAVALEQLFQIAQRRLHDEELIVRDQVIKQKKDETTEVD